VGNIDEASKTIIQPHKGLHYNTLLGIIHSCLKPQTYLEIGARTGGSLALATCRSIAIDPVFKLDPPFFGKKEMCCLYQITSDDFFARYNPEQILGGKINLAFLDGMHLAEYLLRDFINTEIYCNPHSVIAMHDCIPLDAEMARRRQEGPGVIKSEHNTDWWTGDVWKVVAVLKKYRPTLRIYALDSPPTGLILITSLDPSSTVLKDKYFDIVDEFRDDALMDVKTYLKSLNIMPTTEFGSFEQIAKYLYL
jgi:hypothetical protein